ncbi:hypothetical protein D3C78_1812170 [compost metagenome]
MDHQPQHVHQIADHQIGFPHQHVNLHLQWAEVAPEVGVALPEEEVAEYDSYLTYRC